ncbi:MAG: alanine racemase [Acidimicrobiales bacterium]|nr:MAG: alanine racemase [Acidimicrobiales bacterium]
MTTRATRVTIDLGAVAHNVRHLLDISSPAGLMAVVKADAYGHGAAEVAKTALEAGASWLGVALAEEGVELQRHVDSAPILVLSEPSPSEMAVALKASLRISLYTEEGVATASRLASELGVQGRVHLKVDTGMHRAGVAPEEAVRLATLVEESPSLSLEALWTHFACADDPTDSFTDEQVCRFEQVIEALAREGIEPPLRHAANSAATLRGVATGYDLVRCGIAMYGLPPSSALADLANDLIPALTFRSEVAQLRRIRAGEGVSYGLKWRAPSDRWVATVPCGYADGVPRRFGACGGEVLVGGRRRPVVGVVTMDQLVIDVGEELDVAKGDEVVLIGSQGHARVTADEWAEKLGTINYEVVCGITPRVPREYTSRRAKVE